MTFTCGDCWREFPAGWQSRQQHLDATGHDIPSYECQTCDRYFDSQQAVEQHMNALNHWADSDSEDSLDWGCDHCDSAFYEEDDLRQHEREQHFKCDPCDRYFQSWNNLSQHLNSSIHRTSGIACTFCKKTCATATGLIHHLENGSCPNVPLNREKLYEAVRSRDPNGVLSKKLLECHGTMTFTATEKTWNRKHRAYECYLCHHYFNKLVGLNHHLNSPAHKQNLYHCPNRSCGKEFTTLAAVSHHLESESCNYMRFDAVQQHVERVVDPRRMIAF